MGALLGESGGGYFAEYPVSNERKVLGTEIFLHGGLVGQPGVGSSKGDFEGWLEGALEVEHPLLWKLYKGSLEGGLPWWGPWRIGRKGYRDGHHFAQRPC